LLVEVGNERAGVVTAGSIAHPGAARLATCPTSDAPVPACRPGDFTRWKEHDAYQTTLHRLLRDLRVRKTS
jgi:hypothetical protein